MGDTYGDKIEQLSRKANSARRGQRIAEVLRGMQCFRHLSANALGRSYELAQGERDRLTCRRADSAGFVPVCQAFYRKCLDLVAHGVACPAHERYLRLPREVAVRACARHQKRQAVRDRASQRRTHHDGGSASGLLVSYLRVEVHPPDLPRRDVGLAGHPFTAVSSSAHSRASR